VVLVLMLLACTRCTLAARDHACYPFVAHQMGGHIPPSVLRTLAHERGTRKRVGRNQAPIGYYFRPRSASTLAISDIRTVIGDYELARCPAGNATPAPLPSAR